MERKEIQQPHYHAESSETKVFLPSISPLDILKIMSSNDFEEMITEWAYGYLKNKYEKVCHLGGSGDKGRDIAAYYDYKNEIWDNYQCKHYDHKLKPADIWIEIGKCCYYSYIQEYKTPKKYYFVSPCGVNNTLHDLLKDAKAIKRGLIENWSNCCMKKIIQQKEIKLDGEFQNYIEQFDFCIFNYIEPNKLVEQFKETCYYTARFGKLVKPRPIPRPAPEEIQVWESVYIKKILDAYSEYLNKNIENVKKLEQYPDIKKDFERHRTYFFCAEALKEFSRDLYDPDLKVFEDLKKEIYDGIIDTIEEDAKNGFERLRKVLQRATMLSITNNPLIDQVKINDRKGICHHLANEKEDVRWKK